jgi:hypothetical protein
VHKKWHLNAPTPSFKKISMFHSIVGLGDMDSYICMVARWLKQKSPAIGCRGRLILQHISSPYFAPHSKPIIYSFKKFQHSTHHTYLTYDQWCKDLMVCKGFLTWVFISTPRMHAKLCGGFSFNQINK